MSVLVCSLASAPGQQPPPQQLDNEYQLAVKDYEAGRYDQAAGKLEKLLPYAVSSAPVHELLGLVYASMNRTDQAAEQLKHAVQIKPDWVEARTNLGAALLRAGKNEMAGEQFRKALELDPHSYATNHDLGEFYAQSGKISEACPLLEQAHQAAPDDFGNTYDLAMTDFLLGRNDEARSLVLDLVKQKDEGDLHNLLARINEKQGKYVEAATEYERAAHLDPSEDNLFDWGSEMLLHRTYDAAITIFQEAARRYPRTPRMRIGLGLALYSRGKYDEAVKALLAAIDINPSDPRAYVFLSKAYNSSPLQADEVVEAFKHYAEMQPNNAQAQFYYAVSLWKGKRTEDTTLDQAAVESLLLKAVSLDDSLADAHVQLGNLYADQHKYDKSIPQYLRALALDANLADAHYRLGTDYVHVGQKESAQKEFAIYQKLRAQHLDEVEKERAAVQQFVLGAKSDEPAPPDHVN
ncbi:tetratricopeptide repeat protein [Acidobacteria bacterium AB60]|nr:tetratricopeptide repeat protein [Acidobacteria bacterium AB60]